MALISSGNLLGGFREDLRNLESSARDFADSLSRKGNFTLSDMVQLKDRIHRLVQTAETLCAIAGVTHRVIMSIIQSMKHA